MTRRLYAADADLVEYFTSACGVHAQAYESNGGGPVNTSSFDEAFVREIDRARQRERRGLSGSTSMESADKIGATLTDLPADVAETLRLIYEPCGTWFSTGRHSVSKPGRKRTDDEAAPDALAKVLRPSWGGGSFVRMAIGLASVREAFEKKHPKKPITASALRVFLANEATEGDADRKKLFKAARQQCEGTRAGALEVYEVHRLRRIEAERVEQKRRVDQRFDRLSRELRGELS